MLEWSFFRTSTAHERSFLYSTLIFLLMAGGAFFLFVGLIEPSAIIEPVEQAGAAPKPPAFLNLETDDAGVGYTVHGVILLGAGVLLWLLRAAYHRLVD